MFASRQHSCGCVAHRPQITKHHGLHMTHCIPTAFLRGKKGLPVPCTRIMPFLVPTETHNSVHFYWVASYSIQPGCSGCQVPSLNCSHVSPECLQAPVAGCHPCFWSAGSFFNTLRGIREDPDPQDLECEEPMTDPHLV